ncbi:MAG: AlwI family type II restriction endonuclease [Candidatus Cloacimonadaceae bacterium]|nr:AlwI family type II restriction endonuclease [Candidatus Cloacimonadaceae bacterium]
MEFIIIDIYADMLIKWDTRTQEDFYEALYNADFFDGTVKAKNMNLAARDRITRAPKALGFVKLKPVIELTDAGRRLLTGKRIHETITRQLLKFQLPSNYHKGTDNRFWVKPYLELLRLIRDMNGLSKTEIALFYTQLIHINRYDEIQQAILDYRQSKSKFKGNAKQFILDCATKEIISIYKVQIEHGDLTTRESLDTSLKRFVNTKKHNLFDYADAFIRYINATSLMAFDTSQNRIVISNFRIPEVEFILATVDRNPIIFERETDYQNYLFASDTPLLYGDVLENLLSRYSKYVDVSEFRLLAIESVKDRIEEIESRLRQENNLITVSNLKNYSQFDEIIQTYDKIIKRDVIDPPLYFEWNTWRAFEMINYALEVNGFFKSDINGLPISTAPGKVPDLVIEYDNFLLMVEVTLSSGYTQYNMEGEPVARHFGTLMKTSFKPLFCLFITPKLNQSTLAHFFTVNKTNIEFHGGMTNIIPITLQQFIKLLSIAKSCGFNNSSKLYDLLTNIMHHHKGSLSEVLWQNSINTLINSWLQSA